ncbi:MAG: DNA internalization-related competence protein ComEC/Rec2 [Lachnospiraceae bacterium]|nr:DNA internalization-related competence protein ComEC/Rec2 [Lachnospiraceae bacterium]
MKRPLACFCIFFVFTVWLGLMIAGPPDDPYDEYEGMTLSLYGTVEKKEIKSDSEAVYLKNVSITGISGFSGGEEQSKQLNKGIICYMPETDTPPMGSCVFVTGKISGFKKATNPGEFDMREYRLCNGYGAYMKQCSWEMTDGRMDLHRELLWKVRCRLGESISSVFNEEDSGVIRAMLLGDKSELAEDIRALYSLSGIAHILAISGLHISLIGAALYKTLRRITVPVIPSAVISGMLMIEYAGMTGAGTSTLRAVTMFVIMVTADMVRRSYDLPTALSLSALMTITVNPYELMQSGFFMSYLAVTGVAVFGKAVKDGVKIENRYAGKIFDAFISGMSVTVFTFPVTAMTYYEIPVYSVFINLLVIPLMTAVIIFGALSMLMGLVCIPAGTITAIPCHVILCLYKYICNLSDKLPLSHYICGMPSVEQTVLCYGSFILILLLGKKIGFGTRFAIIALATAILLFKVPHGFRLTVLDVGQGDCICVDSGKMVCMIDGGSTSEKEIFEYKIKPFLKHEGISKVDLWFVTHPDTDHISGLTEMLALDDMGGLNIGSIVLPDAKGAAEDCREIISLANKQGIRVMFFSTGEEACSGRDKDDLHIVCLHPAAGYDTEDINSYSQVLEISCGDFEGIFTGDASADSEKAILRSINSGSLAGQIQAPPDGYDVLKAGHHGSSTSSSKEWLEFVKPKTVIISCGKNNPYGHPHSEVIDRLKLMECEILRTDEMGAVIINEEMSK